uniref:Uncharacterized protein n=1 Tax=Schimmelmannia schousboei TaxID=173468 RepID=A0A1C9C8M9_9FLOR|nr:hypothetical protein Schim_050 [Schimmelmannia schousboei]AOM64731.1 hypothetical protein Schim_050 [Schimmelmannia schousboei]
MYIFLPCKIQGCYINQKDNLRRFRIYYCLSITPEFIIRFSLITILYYISLQLLFLTTHYEYIIIYFLQFLIEKFHFNSSKFFFVSSLASELLNVISKRVNITIIAVKLRKTHNITPKHIFVYYLILRIFDYILNDIVYVSSVLYTREIKYNNINKINVYRMKL